MQQTSMVNRPIAVSLKSRGLIAYEYRAGQLRDYMNNALLDISDISIAIVTDVLLLSPAAWLSIVLTILSCVFYFYYQDGLLASNGSILIPVVLLIHLPTLCLALMVHQRRLQAAAHLNKVQSQVLGLYVLHGGLAQCGAPQLLEQLDDDVSNTMVQLQGYLSHPRALNVSHFSWSSIKGGNVSKDSKLFQLGQDIGHRLRQLHSSLRKLSATVGQLLEHCSVSSEHHYQPQVLCLLQLLVALDDEIMQLTSIKDLRSPLLLRAVLRPGCVLLAPLLSGSWLAGLAGSPGRTAAGAVYAMVAGIIVLLMTLYTLALQLEDPFEAGPGAHPDTLCLLEFNHTLSYLTAPPEAVEGAAAVEPPAAGMTPPPGLERGMHQQQPHVAHAEYPQYEGLQDYPGFPQITISQQQQQQQQQPAVAFSSGSPPLGATATAPAGDPSLPESGAVS